MKTDPEIGFIGVGVMGLPIAKHLLAHGTPLLAWNRSPGRAEQLIPHGARLASGLDEVFADAEIILTMLSDEAALDAVMDRAGPSFAARAKGRLIVHMGTTDAPYSRQLGDEIEAAGGRYVEAPVSGSLIPAERGELVAMLAGEAEDITRVSDLIAPACRATIPCGRAPRAMAMKHATNMVLAPLLAGIGEAVAYVRAADLDLAQFSEIVLGGQIASDILRAKMEKVLSGDYSAQGAVKNALQSASAAMSSAGAVGMEAEVITAACRVMQGAAEDGLADQDISVLNEWLSGRVSET